MKRVLKFIMSLFLVCTVLQGCTNDRKNVAYTIYPIGYLIDYISGETVNTVCIQDDEEPYVVQSAQLITNYRDILKNSLGFFHIGKLEPYLAIMASDIIESGTDDQDLAPINAVYDFNRYTIQEVDGTKTFVESPYYVGSAFDSIDVTTKDLSLWNDPISMISMAGSIRDWLCNHYPKNAELYIENYKKLESEFISLDSRYQNFATSLATKGITLSFVSMTPSYGNWQKTYGFQVYPIILSRYGVLPNEEQLELIEKRIRTDNVKYILYESNMTEEMKTLYSKVEADCGLTRVDFSNLSALSINQYESGKDYLSIMYENLSQLQTMTTQNNSETNDE